jgi:NADH pyrophosphatase NudC (nudix superfamily)
MPEVRYCPQCARELDQRQVDGRTRKVCPDAACGYVHWGNPTPVVAAIVQRDDDVLLVRPPSFPPKVFGLVTGFLEADEAPDAGVLREVEEELGLTGEVVSLVGLYPFAAMNQLLIVYHVRVAGEVVLGDELEDVKPVAVAKLKPWAFGTGLALADWLADVRGGDE